jgi:hypothetical protein
MPSRVHHLFARFIAPTRRGMPLRTRRRVLRTRLGLEILEYRIVPAIFNVNSTADVLSPPAGTVTLRSAIEQANATPGGNIINLTVPGVYKITIPPATPDDTPATENNATGDFDILPSGGNLAIVNTSGGAVAVDGNHLDRVFDINSNVDPATPKFAVFMRGFTIQNGIALPGDGATGSGGGIRDQGNASLVLSDMVVTNNRATADGGGISMENAVSAAWMLVISQSRITNNRAGDAGGGVETDGSGSISINESLIINNTSVNQGGGIWLDAIQVGTVFQSANLAIMMSTVANNRALSAATFGGGIGNAGNGAVAIGQSTIAGNFSGGAGGGFADQKNQGTLAVTNSVFGHNTAVGDGGGIAEGGPSTTIGFSELRGNASGGNGGGMAVAGTTLIVMNSTLTDNTSAAHGGGIELNTTGKALAGSQIIDTTIAGNSALKSTGAFGGGIDADVGFTGDLTLINDTINANFASIGGGVVWEGATGSTFSVQNTIIAQNTAATAPDAANAAGPFNDLGGNLIGISGDNSGNTGFFAPTTQRGTVASPLDPLLGPLQDNGGPSVGAPGFEFTLQTEALRTGSPAIGKGILNGAPPIDERGFPSVVNGQINVGAVSQVQPTPGDGHDGEGEEHAIRLASQHDGAWVHFAWEELKTNGLDWLQGLTLS